MFPIEWTEEADRDLEQIWLHDEDPATRERILHSLGVFNAELESRADQYGESRSGTLRIGFEPPLAILFDFEDNVVYIARVMLYGK